MSAQPKNSPIDVDLKLDALDELRQRKKDIAAELKEVEQDFNALRDELMDIMDQQGTNILGNSRFRVSITESEVPDIVDWELVHGYIMANDAPYMFERRLSTAAWREALESGELIPGTKPFTKRTLSLRKAPNT